MAHRIPPLRRHKRKRRKDQAYVAFDGRRTYLGVWGSPAANAAYKQFVAQWETGSVAALPAREDLTVVELAAAFLEHAEGYYRRADGSPTGHADKARYMLQHLDAFAGETPVSRFGPKLLRGLQEFLIGKDLSRSYINMVTALTKQVVRWGVTQELVDESIPRSLQYVPGLRRGRSGARETEAKRPVPKADVDAVRPHLNRQVAAMVDTQLLTGARPGEVVIMRPRDMDRSGDVWRYVPHTHKTEHHGQARVVLIGPKAQGVLAAFMARNPDMYLFSPAEAEAERLAARHAARRTPLSCGNVPGSNRKRRTKRKPADRYSAASYRTAIQRACERAGVERWHPHRLRHNAGTRIRSEFDLETARTVLGHRGVAVTELYAQRDLTLAIHAAEATG